MNVKCFGTGSSGNGYVVELQDGSYFLLDAGVSPSTISKEVNLNNIDYGFVSHEHRDHSRYLENYRYFNVKILDGINNHTFNKNSINLKNGGLDNVYMFNVEHGETNNSALILQDNKNLLLYATDFNICKYNLKKFPFTHLMVECNYLEEYAEREKDNIKVLRQINTHMGMKGLVKFLNTLDMTKVENIDLLHISQGYGDETIFKSVIQSLYPNAKVRVAKQFGGFRE